MFIKGRMNFVLVHSILSLSAFVSDQISSNRYNISLGGGPIFFLLVFILNYFNYYCYFAFFLFRFYVFVLFLYYTGVPVLAL